jgi:hypothetical protein
VIWLIRGGGTDCQLKKIFEKTIILKHKAITDYVNKTKDLINQLLGIYFMKHATRP